MNLFNQFVVFAESRGEGLHPKLRALLERAGASRFTMRRDGLMQAGPSPQSEAVSSRSNVVLLSRGPMRPAVAASKPEMRRLSPSNRKGEPV